MKTQLINTQLTIQNLSAGFASNNLQTANPNQIMQQATAIRTPISAGVPDLMFPLGHGEAACIRQHHYNKYNLVQTNSAPSFTSASSSLAHLNAGFTSNKLQAPNMNQTIQLATAISTPVSAVVAVPTFSFDVGEHSSIRQYHYVQNNRIQVSSASSFTLASSSSAHAGFASNKLQEPNINQPMLLATAIRTPMSAGVADPTFCLDLGEDANIRQQQYKIMQANSAPRFTSLSSIQSVLIMDYNY